VGTVSIEVKATDNEGATRSDFANVILDAPDNYAPRVSITSPTDGSILQVSTFVTLGSSATDPDGDAICRVRWYYSPPSNPSSYIYIGEDLDNPYESGWNTTGLTAGEYIIRSIVYNQNCAIEGTISEDAITVTIQE
jgi:hypothetical protein